MMTSESFVEMLRVAHDVPNKYNNKPGYNLGYFDGKKYNFDCWNLIKVILAGWVPTGVPGSKTDPSVTGDVDGKTLLAKCTQKSKDFRLISVPGTYLYMSTNPHAGVFVGEFQDGGHIYNVIECTKGMYAGQDGVTYSYVDPSGVRMPWKGGSSKGKWTDYGLLTPYVTYYDIPEPATAPIGHKVLQKGSEGAEVKVLQKKLNDILGAKLVIDGKFGPKTETAVKQFQKSRGIEVDGKVGPITWGELEKDIPEKPKTEEKYYTVKYGDTFSGIAKKCKVKESDLKKLNPDIKNYDLIYAGQKIRVQ